MAWYDKAVFYHIYPLGLCGCPHENEGGKSDQFETLNQWARHANKLNCTAIYIGPLFESGSHGYDTIDYRNVDSRLGTNASMRQFVKNCHELGMHVIVDGVFNHVGRGFFAFQDLLQNRENSVYRDWFCDVNFTQNNEYNDGFSYGNWGGYNLLAKLNLKNPAVKQYHLDTVKFWTEEYGIDGIRLDAADVLDFDFMHELRVFCDGLKPEFWLMGEVIHGDYSRYANPSMLHSVTDYELHKGLYSGHNDHNYFEIAHSVTRLLGICHETRLYTFSDNHDVERLASKITVKEHEKLVAVLVYTLYGIPSIYYGSEFGIEGRQENGSDWPLRPALSIERANEERMSNPLTIRYTQLGQLKKEYAELTDGSYQQLLLTNRQFGYARISEHSAVIVVLNNDEQPAAVTLQLPFTVSECKELLNTASEEGKLSDTEKLSRTEKLSDAEVTGQNLKVTLSQNSARIFSVTY